MFSPSKYVPANNTFTDHKNATTSVNFTKNLYDLQFRPQGTGRDSYIHYDNGGFNTLKQNAQNLNQPGTMSPDPKRRQSSIQPYQAPAIETQRPQFYRMDGTGRDSYIHQNNGGFTTSNLNAVAIDPRIVFSKNLRSYNPNPDYLSRRKYNAQGQKMLTNPSRSPSPTISEDGNGEFGEPRQSEEPVQKQTRTIKMKGANDLRNSQNRTQFDYVTTYMNQMCNQNDLSARQDRTKEIREIQEKLLASKQMLVQQNKKLRRQGDSTEISPLKGRETTLRTLEANTFQTAGEKALNNLISPRLNKSKPPSIAHYNPSNESINRMSAYLTKLDSRLSQPKNAQSRADQAFSPLASRVPFQTIVKPARNIPSPTMTLQPRGGPLQIMSPTYGSPNQSPRVSPRLSPAASRSIIKESSKEPLYAAVRRASPSQLEKLMPSPPSNLFVQSPTQASINLKQSLTRATPNMHGITTKNLTSTASLLKNVESQQSLHGMPTMNTVGSNANLLTNQASVARLSPSWQQPSLGGQGPGLGSMPAITFTETVGGTADASGPMSV